MENYKSEVFSYNRKEAEDNYDRKLKDLHRRKKQAKEDNNWMVFESVVRQQIELEKTDPRRPVLI